MSPSPIREEYQREIRVKAPSMTAITAMIRDSEMTTPEFLGMTPLSMICPSSSGVATTRPASKITRTRKSTIWDLYGFA